jgi:hypothetical protein
MKILKFRKGYINFYTNHGKRFIATGKTRLEAISKAIEEIKLSEKGFLII